MKKRGSYKNRIKGYINAETQKNRIKLQEEDIPDEDMDTGPDDQDVSEQEGDL